MTTTVPKAVLKELIYLTPGDTLEGVRLVLDEQFGTGRWVSHHRIVVAVGDEFFAAQYTQGLTEMQDGEPFEYDPDDVPMTQVFARERVVVVYES